ncbi:MAG: transglutaminase domain-containing protein [Candidatus Pacebacteria bacterium]|nr:transglutaminase domain-containing protein [Candidatus Paceibacterota bacterium]
MGFFSFLNTETKTATPPERKHMPSGWESVPPVVLEHISRSPEVIPNSVRVVESALTGAHEAVRTMIWADHVKHMARSFYECWQGLRDFGFIGKDRKGWKPPSIEIIKHGEGSRFQHREDFFDADEIQFRNFGFRDLATVTMFGNATGMFEELASVNEVRDGGYGQGTKIVMCALLANAQDRREVIDLILNDPKSGLTKEEKRELSQYQTQLEREEDFQQEDSPFFATIQACDEDGHYFRVYCYRESLKFDRRPLWTLKFLVVQLDPAKIASEDKNTVITSLHHPTKEIQEAFSHAQENILDVHPQYPSETSLVKPEEGSESMLMTTISSEKTEAKPLIGSWSIEILQESSPKIYFRGTHMIPQALRDMKLFCFSYNIASVGPETFGTVNRVSNSTAVSGPIPDMIRASIASCRDSKVWAKIFRAYIEYAPSDGITSTDDEQRYPEFSPLFEKYKALSPQVIDTIIYAFNEVFPRAERHFAYNADAIHSYQFLSGKDCMCPLFPKGPLVEYLRSTLKVLPIESLVESELKKNGQTIKSNEGFLRLIKIPQHALREDEKRPPEDMVLDCMLTTLSFEKTGLSYYITNDGRLEITMKSVPIEGPHQSLQRSFDHGKKVEDNSTIKFLSFMQSMKSLGFSTQLWANEWCTEFGVHDNQPFLSYGTASYSYGFFPREYRKEDRDKPHVECKLVIRGNVEKLVRILGKLDEKTQSINPDWSKRKTEADSLELILTNLREQADKGQVALRDLDRAKEKLDEFIKESERRKKEAEQIQRSLSSDILARLPWRERMSGPGGTYLTGSNEWITSRRVGRRGPLLQALFTESAFAHSSMPFLVDQASYDNASIAKEEGRERVSFGNTVWKAHWRTNAPSYYPTNCYDTAKETTDGILLESEAIVPVPATFVGFQGWLPYNPKDENGYLDVQDDGLVETEKDVIPTNREIILPVSGEYSILYISFPWKSSDSASVPTLMFDAIHNHYVIIFPPDLQGSGDSAKANRLPILPKGTRIYLKKKEANADNNEFIEHQLEDRKESYELLLKTPITKYEELDDETKGVLELIHSRGSALSRDQIVTIIYLFWKKRRLYDPQPEGADRIISLIKSGKGNCQVGAVPLLELLRYAGIPCRVRSVHTDNDGTGILDSVGHLAIEWFGESGTLHYLDPPNSKISPEFSQQIAQNILHNVSFTVLDVEALRGQAHTPTAQIPIDIALQLSALNEHKGVALTSTFLQDAANLSTTQKQISVDMRKRMIGELAKAIREDKEKKETSPDDPAHNLSIQYANILIERLRQLSADIETLRLAQTDITGGKEMLLKHDFIAREAEALVREIVGAVL